MPKVYTIKDVISKSQNKKQDSYIVEIPEGLKLQDLRASGLMWDQDWYDQYNFTAPAGRYEVMMLVPNSKNKTWDEQKEMLKDGWEPCPVIVGAVLWIAHKKQTGVDLLDDNWSRFAEKSNGNRVALFENDGRLYVHIYWNWDNERNDRFWASAARRLPDTEALYV